MAGAPTKSKRKAGSPSLDVSAKDAVLEWISSGKTLTAFSKVPGNPGRNAILGWRKTDPEFDKAMDEARTRGADVIAEEALEIIDTLPKPGQYGTDSGHVQWLRNRAEFRLKVLEKWFPTTYGKRMELGGGLTHTHNVASALSEAMDLETGVKNAAPTPVAH